MSNNITNKSLLILQFNINGLKNDVNELETVLHDKRIDFALNRDPLHQIFFHLYPRLQIIKNQSPRQHCAWWSYHFN